MFKDKFIYFCWKIDICKFMDHLTGSLGPGNQGLAKIADIEHGRCLDIVPVLLGERVHAEKTENMI